MRWILIAVLVSTLTCPTWAAKPLTVAQLEQMLTAEGAAHKSDAEIARKINGIDLSERLTEKTLGQMSEPFAANSQAKLALLLLADRSAFLDPPPNELPPMPAPDTVAQRQMLQAVNRFVLETLPRLPDLLATRTTFSFDDSPQEVTKGGYLQRIGLHLVGTSKVQVSIRNERENVTVEPGHAPLPAQAGLTTWGEFGSALLIILRDSSHGAIAWSHWEQSSSGLLAVFHYQVPRSASHYEVDTPAEVVQPNGWGWVIPNSTRVRMKRTDPAYAGSLWIDPASGIIKRVTLMIDLKGNSALEHGAILVDYGPVYIANRTLICPLRSLALSSAPATVDNILQGVATEWLNENLFTGYHLFASTSKILSAQAAQSALAAPGGESASSTARALPSVPAPENSPSSAPSASTQIAAPAMPEPATEAVPANPPPHPLPAASSTQTNAAGQPPAADQSPPLSATGVEHPPIDFSGRSATVSAAPNPSAVPLAVTPPSQPASGNSNSLSPATAPDSGVILRVEVKAVLVPVVVRDSHGQSIDHLEKQDFHAFDDGKPRPLSGFLIERHEPPQKTPKSAEDSPGAPPTETAPQTAALPDRVTVFVFDDLHLTSRQLALVQKAALQALDGALTGSDVAAVVSTSGKINSGLTRDHAKLTDAIMALRPLELFRPDSNDCPKLDYYQADLIVNKHDTNALQDAIGQVIAVCDPGVSENLAERIAESTAMRVLNLSRQDVLTTYDAISEIVHRMANLPGQHIMVLVSPGFLPVEEEARNAEAQLINRAADSSVTINALDAQGLFTTAVTASEDTRARNPGWIQSSRQRAGSLAEASMDELAESTGGVFFQNNNDLGAGFAKLLDAPETVYLLELPLDGVKPNGAYHRLKVKVDRAGVSVQARCGYFAPRKSRERK